jgi:hypothetical protein
VIPNLGDLNMTNKTNKWVMARWLYASGIMMKLFIRKKYTQSKSKSIQMKEKNLISTLKNP